MKVGSLLKVEITPKLRAAYRLAKHHRYILGYGFAAEVETSGLVWLSVACSLKELHSWNKSAPFLGHWSCKVRFVDLRELPCKNSILFSVRLTRFHSFPRPLCSCVQPLSDGPCATGKLPSSYTRFDHRTMLPQSWLQLSNSFELYHLLNKLYFILPSLLTRSSTALDRFLLAFLHSSHHPHVMEPHGDACPSLVAQGMFSKWEMLQASRPSTGASTRWGVADAGNPIAKSYSRGGTVAR